MNYELGKGGEDFNHRWRPINTDKKDSTGIPACKKESNTDIPACVFCCNYSSEFSRATPFDMFETLCARELKNNLTHFFIF